MPRGEPEIFISYRRSDVAGWAVALFQRLSQALGDGVVFMDTDGIEPGDAFPTRLADALDSARVVIVLMGPRWSQEVRERSALGQRDWVVHEIETAFKRGTRVVPVIVDKASMPSASDLPESISHLHNLHYFEVRGSAYGRDVDGLVEEMEDALAADAIEQARGGQTNRGVKTILDAAGWASLIARVESGACVPVLGPAVSPDVEPQLQSLLSRARTVPASLIGDTELPRVAQAVTVGVDRAFVRQALTSAHQDQANQATPERDGCEPFARLNVPLYLTTSYSNELAVSLGKRERPARMVEPARQSRLDGGIGLALEAPPLSLDVKEPTVVHLFGRYDNPGQMTVTEDDFFDLLVRMSREQGFFDPAVRSQLATSSLLFVGFRLDDWRFRLLLRGFGAQLADTGISSIAVVQVDPEDIPDGHDESTVSGFVERYFTSGRAVDVRAYVGSAQSFTADLEQRLSKSLNS